MNESKFVCVVLERSYLWGRKGGSLLSDGLINDRGGIFAPFESIAGLEPRATAIADPWFALRVKSNFERVTANHLTSIGYQGLLPSYVTRKRWSDRTKSTEKPLFPGYVFCRFDLQRRLPILTAPGVLHIVGVGKTPAALDEREIEAIRITVGAGLAVVPWPFLQVGERVEVVRGPLKGIEGIVIQLKGAYRLVVSVSLLQRSIATEIERDWINPVGQSRFLAGTQKLNK